MLKITEKLLFLLSFLLSAATMLAVFAVIYMAPPPVSALAHAWYDKLCCNEKDCRPVSGVNDKGIFWSEIANKGDHYLFRSSQTGKVYKIPVSGKGNVSVRPSKDQNFHACEISFISPYNGLNSDPSGRVSWLRCLYVPQMF